MSRSALLFVIAFSLCVGFFGCSKDSSGLSCGGPIVTALVGEYFGTTYDQFNDTPPDESELNWNSYSHELFLDSDGTYLLNYHVNGSLTDQIGCWSERDYGGNDQCTDATAVSEGSFPYDLTGSTLDGPNDCEPDALNDVWFEYTATADGTATISTCSQSGTNEDSVLIVYDGAICPGPGTPCLASNDNAFGVCGLMSSVDVLVFAGNSYMVQVSGGDGEEGTGTLDISVGGGEPDGTLIFSPAGIGCTSFEVDYTFDGLNLTLFYDHPCDNPYLLTEYYNRIP